MIVNTLVLKYPFFFVFVFCFLQSTAQQVEFLGGAEISGLFSSNESLPFWFYTETNTAVGELSSVSGQAFAKATYSLSEKSQFEAEVSAFYRDEVPTSFQRNNLYVSFTNNWLQITAGAKKQKEEAYGLSMTNKNFIWNNNARAIPGVLLEANNPLKISEVFLVDWGIGNYFLNDARYVSDVMIHYKRLAVIAKLNEKNKITIRLQHVAQWGGTSPDFGKLPTDFSTFLKVFLAKKTVVENGIENQLGNHIGSLMIDYQFKTEIGNINIYFDHPFEDGSGTRYANFPDGLWGILFSPENSKFIRHILYEYSTTTDQSGAVGQSGIDNYFSHSLYRSGWTYEQTIIGFPFILTDKTIEITNLTSPIISNRVTVHHLALSGNYKKLAWKLKSSYAKHLGTYRHPYPTSLKVWSSAIWLQYDLNKYGKCLLLTGIDSSSGNSTLGVGVGYKYVF